MPEEYKAGWICLGLLILFGLLITQIPTDPKSARQITVETQCEPTDLYVIDGQRHINQIYDCEEVDNE